MVRSAHSTGTSEVPAVLTGEAANAFAHAEKPALTHAEESVRAFSASPEARSLLIVNPVAQNGAGRAAGELAARLLRADWGFDVLDVAFTERSGHAVELAAGAAGYAAVIALGGDGIVNEVANGLMRLPDQVRPMLGVVPAGSGEDYARSLGIAHSVEGACAQLAQAEPRAVDVGCVNGRYFVETLSFGLDAAIAFDTVERRVRTGLTGTRLYMAAGFDQIAHHLHARRYRASFDGAAPVAGESITFAIQVGPYYGGGFKVCPDTRVDDGELGLCIAHPPMGPLYAVLVFLCAKFGRHGGFRAIELARCRQVAVEFDEAPPAQVDGERIEGARFEVRILPGALRVLAPRGAGR